MDPDLKTPLASPPATHGARRSMDTRAFVDAYLGAVAIVGYAAAVALLITCSILLGHAVACAGINLEGKTFKTAQSGVESMCLLYPAARDPVAAYAIGVGLSGFVLLFAFVLLFVPCVLTRMGLAGKSRPLVSLGDAESAKALESMFVRDGTTLCVKAGDTTAAFDVYEANGRRFGRPQRITKPCVIADFDVRGMTVGEMEADELVTDACQSWLRRSEFETTDVVVRVEVQCDSLARTFVVVPRQGWSASRVREELCRILLGV
jgi:hypothetical protein